MNNSQSLHLEDVDVETVVRDIMARNLNLEPSEVKDEAHFITEMGGSSLDFYQVVSDAEEAFDVELEFGPEEEYYTLKGFSEIVRGKMLS